MEQYSQLQLISSFQLAIVLICMLKLHHYWRFERGVTAVVLPSGRPPCCKGPEGGAQQREAQQLEGESTGDTACTSILE